MDESIYSRRDSIFQIRKETNPKLNQKVKAFLSIKQGNKYYKREIELDDDQSIRTIVGKDVKIVIDQKEIFDIQGRDIKNKNIVIIPQLKGGITQIYMQNINGFPSNKHNTHKKRGINEIMGKQDIALFLETGINDKAIL